MTILCREPESQQMMTIITNLDSNTLLVGNNILNMMLANSRTIFIVTISMYRNS